MPMNSPRYATGSRRATTNRPTNVQKRLVAVHHLDAPWKPAEVEQRDGRILRQGNTNAEVAVYRYVTEGSFDSYMWQALETKAKFIGQVMTGETALYCTLGLVDVFTAPPCSCHLAEAVELTLHLVHDTAAAGGIVACDQVLVPLTIIGILDAPHAAVDASTERRHRVAHTGKGPAKTEILSRSSGGRSIP